jgi:hypothetical protein
MTGSGGGNTDPMEYAHRRANMPGPSAEARQIADRLQELSVDEAERVLERAIELQTRSPGGPPASTIDTQMLAAIAAELDIDAQHLQQAIIEELLRVETEAPGVVDRLLVPPRMTGHGVAPGDPPAVREVVDAWMVNHEGMRKLAETGSVSRWERDQGLGAAMRRHLRMSRGRRDLRTTAGVTTSVRPATDDQQIVVMDADTSNLRRLAIGLLAGSAALGGAAAAVGSGFGTGLDGLVAGAGVFGVLASGVLLGVKMWAARVRDGLDRALDAIRSPHLVDRGTSIPSTLRRFVDGLRDAGGRRGRDEPEG